MNAQDHQHCDSCHSTLKSSLYCVACERLQQLDEADNYFGLFNQALSYQIEEQAIEQQFDDLVMRLHPDFFATADERDQALSLQHTSLLHEAKACLFNPFERGKYLLGLLRPGQEVALGTPPASFMVEMFGYQEALDELEQSQGDPGPLAGQIQRLQSELQTSLTQSFTRLQQDPQNAELAKGIQDELAKVKFFMNLQTRIKEIKKRTAWKG